MILLCPYCGEDISVGERNLRLAIFERIYCPHCNQSSLVDDEQKDDDEYKLYRE